jgi:nicotinamide mononucleotide transporter
MPIPHFLQTIITQLQQSTWQELVSFIAQVASVLYARKNNVLVYPTGIIGVILASYVYYFISNPPLYGEGTVNIYYLLMSIYGWYAWLQKNNNITTNPISWCNKTQLSIGIAIFLLGGLLIKFILQKYSTSNTINLDALATASAVTAMWWMAKRKIENWAAWIVSNAIAIPLNFYKGFYLFTLMYIIFLVLAVLGHISWVKTFKKNNT